MKAPFNLKHAHNLKVIQFVAQKMPPLAQQHRLCSLIKWGSLSAFFFLILFMVGLEYITYIKYKSSILTPEHLNRLSIGTIILMGLFCFFWILGDSLPASPEKPKDATRTAQMSTQQRIHLARQWYKSAIYRMQCMGILFASAGIVIHFEPLLSIVLLVALMVLLGFHLKDNRRRPAKRFFREQSSAERAYFSISLQAMFLFTFSLTFLCAHVALHGFANVHQYIFLQATLFFAFLAFLYQFYVLRFLARME
ncbi:MAG: hypothetical protein ACK5M5_04850 [Limnobaculum xujianqingii]